MNQTVASKYGIIYNHNGGDVWEGYYVDPDPLWPGERFATFDEAARAADVMNIKYGHLHRNRIQLEGL